MGSIDLGIEPCDGFLASVTGEDCVPSFIFSSLCSFCSFVFAEFFFTELIPVPGDGVFFFDSRLIPRSSFWFIMKTLCHRALFFYQFSGEPSSVCNYFQHICSFSKVFYIAELNTVDALSGVK